MSLAALVTNFNFFSIFLNKRKRKLTPPTQKKKTKAKNKNTSQKKKNSNEISDDSIDDDVE